MFLIISANNKTQEKCPHSRIETLLESSKVDYDKEYNQFVVMRGFLERCADCKTQLGEGYGDVDYFKTFETANNYVILDSQKLGIWYLSIPVNDLSPTEKKELNIHG